MAPLNWGLGHATRCIPIINALLKYGFEPVLASDGAALELLQKEFPSLTSVELPSYDITYAKKPALTKLKLLIDTPKILKTITLETEAVKDIVFDHNIDGILSDNRFGVFDARVPSIYITHQLHVLSGSTTWLSSKIHQNIIKKFDACWIPDTNTDDSLSGMLSHPQLSNMKTSYIGPISRFKKKECDIQYDITVLLSGPEPHRTLLEEKLLIEFENYQGNVLFIKGVIAAQQTIEQRGCLKIYNYMVGSQLETALNESDLIISRSGYTTIMDLAALGKRSFFIPTPGQYEQEYLARRLTKKGLVPHCKQQDFKLEKLNAIPAFKGLSPYDYTPKYEELFDLF